MAVNKEHKQYKAYLYWKKNKDTIKNRIRDIYDLKFIP